MKDSNPFNPRIVCRDGFSVSVQSHSGSYCIPRQAKGPHTHYECGFPSSVPLSESLREHAENDLEYTETVYPYVPRQVIEQELELHGGIESGEIPY